MSNNGTSPWKRGADSRRIVTKKGGKLVAACVTAGTANLILHRVEHFPAFLEAIEAAERAGALACSCPDDRWFTCWACKAKEALASATGES